MRRDFIIPVWMALLGLLSTSTAIAAPKPTFITACPTAITQSGLYEVKSGIRASGDCITIKARNVTLGLTSSIVNSGTPNTGTGIRISSRATGAVIRGWQNGGLGHFGVGIEDDAGDAVIGNITILSSKTAFVLNGASTIATMLDDVYMTGLAGGSGNGIEVRSPAGARIVDTTVVQFNTYGILLDAGAGPSVLGGITNQENVGTNIGIQSSGNVVGSCTEGNSQSGIVIAKGAGSNIVTGCSQNGFPPPTGTDAVDNNTNCGTNAWFDNSFASTNRSCIDNPAGFRAVSSCGAISNGGRYRLTANLTKRRGDCLDIRAPNVTLFLANSTITGRKSGIGLHVLPTATAFRGFGGTKGSEIYGFAVGAQIDADGAVVAATGAENAANTGILVNGAAGVTLGANDASGNAQFGYHFLRTSEALLHHFSALSNKNYGVFLEHATGSLLSQFVAGNSGGGNGIAGIYLGCSVTGPGNPCDSEPSVNNTITGGSVYDNTQYGVLVDAGSDRNVLTTISAGGAGIDDAFDANTNCANNLWFYDALTTSNNRSCMNQQ